MTTIVTFKYLLSHTSFMTNIYGEPDAGQEVDCGPFSPKPLLETELPYKGRKVLVVQFLSPPPGERQKFTVVPGFTDVRGGSTSTYYKHCGPHPDSPPTPIRVEIITEEEIPELENIVRTAKFEGPINIWKKH